MSQKFTKTINAWCSYDIANSVYKLLITTVLFPIYYKAITDDTVMILGIRMKDTVVYDYALALAYLIIAFVAPLLSGIADYGGYRKRFMQFFTFLGSAACVSLFFFNNNNLYFGLLMIILAAIGYEGGDLFYNSFLPRIADKSLHDRMSARGYSWGYAGSMILLAANLYFIKGLDMHVRYSFLQTGIWWFTIAWIAFIFLKDSKSETIINGNLLKHGFIELKTVRKKIFQNIVTRRFLSSFFFYSMGLQTLMLVAIMFGKSEVGVGDGELIATILILQAVAILGANFFAWISKIAGNKQSIIAMLFIWLAVCIGGYLVQTVGQFYILAGGVGLVMGGIQSQSRSTFSKLIPRDSNDTASYFSFYNFSEKIAIVFGMFSFGFIEHITGNARNSTLALALYFVIALLIIWRTPLKRIGESNHS